VTAALPERSQLRSFARSAARFLLERRPHAVGARHHGKRVGVGAEMLDLRDYTLGDDVRAIDWRQTARLGRPIVRRFETPAADDWVIAIDASSSMATHGAEKWAAATRAAAAMAFALLDIGGRVAVMAFGNRPVLEIPAGRGLRQYDLIMRKLGAFNPLPSGEGSHCASCASRLPRSASVLLLSDFFADDGMVSGLTTLRESCRSLSAIQLVDPRDALLPVGEAVLAVDAETGERRPLKADTATLATAAQARTSATHRLQRFCALQGVPFSTWRIDDPWQPALIGHLRSAHGQ